MTVRAGVLDVWVAGKHLPGMSTHGSCADDVHHQPSDTLTQPRRNIRMHACAVLSGDTKSSDTNCGEEEMVGPPRKISHKSSSSAFSPSEHQ